MNGTLVASLCNLDWAYRAECSYCSIENAVVMTVQWLLKSLAYRWFSHTIIDWCTLWSINSLAAGRSVALNRWTIQAFPVRAADSSTCLCGSDRSVPALPQRSGLQRWISSFMRWLFIAYWISSGSDKMFVDSHLEVCKYRNRLKCDIPYISIVVVPVAWRIKVFAFMWAVGAHSRGNWYSTSLFVFMNEECMYSPLLAKLDALQWSAKLEEIFM